MKASYDVKKSYVNNSYICYFKIDGERNYEVKGTNGTGLKIYPTKEKAISAGKRYLLEMYAKGFVI